MQVRSVKAALVDLFVIEEGRELIAKPVAQSRISKPEASVLVAWATRVGYRRLWLPDRVVELHAAPAGGTAMVRCRSCGARWEDASPNFWLMVRDEGHFPAICPACGDSLPEWDVDETLQCDEELAAREWSQLQISEGKERVGERADPS